MIFGPDQGWIKRTTIWSRSVFSLVTLLKFYLNQLSNLHKNSEYSKLHTSILKEFFFFKMKTHVRISELYLYQLQDFFFFFSNRRLILIFLLSTSIHDGRCWLIFFHPQWSVQFSTMPMAKSFFFSRTLLFSTKIVSSPSKIFTGFSFAIFQSVSFFRFSKLTDWSNSHHLKRVFPKNGTKVFQRFSSFRNCPAFLR